MNSVVCCHRHADILFSRTCLLAQGLYAQGQRIRDELSDDHSDEVVFYFYPILSVVYISGFQLGRLDTSSSGDISDIGGGHNTICCHEKIQRIFAIQSCRFSGNLVQSEFVCSSSAYILFIKLPGR